MPYSVRTYNTIKKIGVNQFKKRNYTVSDKEKNPDAIVCRSANLHEETLGKNLKVIARAGVGVNNIPIEKCTQRGIIVSNTPGANSTAVKELVIAGMIMSSRNLHHSVRWIQSLQDNSKLYKPEGLTPLVEQEKKKLAGRELYKKTLGIIGLGAIGEKLAIASMSLGMEVVGFDPYLSKDHMLLQMPHFSKTQSLEDLFSKSDYISLHLPYTQSTHHLVNKNLFLKCKKDCVILNFARPELVHEKDLLSALQAKKVSCYVTDFPTEKLLHHNSVLSIPHLGASTKESEENCASMACEQIWQYLEYGNIVNSVNFPSCSMEINTKVKTRLLIGNINTKNVIANITSHLTSYNVNIEEMINKHKNDISYNIIDIGEKIDGKAIRSITSLKDIIFVRHIFFTT